MILLPQVQTFKETIQSIFPGEEPLLEKALDFAIMAHEGQTRKDGQPYIIHPIEIAINLAQSYKNIPLTIAGLLHDTVEDNETITQSHIYENFGEEVGFLVDAVTKDIPTFYHQEKVFKNNTEKLLHAGMENISALVLKLADRENNVATLRNFKLSKQSRISFETQALYIPLQKIIGYKEAGSTLESCHRKLHEYLEKNNIQTLPDLQNSLYKFFFKEFKQETFEEVYPHSDKIIWEIRDMDQFEQLCQNPTFEKNAKVTSLSCDGTNFCAQFQLMGAHVHTNDTKVTIASFHS